MDKYFTNKLPFIGVGLIVASVLLINPGSDGVVSSLHSALPLLIVAAFVIFAVKYGDFEREATPNPLVPFTTMRTDYRIKIAKNEGLEKDELSPQEAAEWNKIINDIRDNEA